jgi:hypothetical protein
MFYRTKEVSGVSDLALDTFDLEEWCKEDKNIALTNGQDYVILTYERDKIYAGHYFFRSRGKEALKVAREALKEIFTFAEVLIGLTPTSQRKALWFTRQLGFTSHGILERSLGPSELFILTRKEFENGRQY